MSPQEEDKDRKILLRAAIHGINAPVWKYRTYHLVHCPHKDASESSGPVGGTDTGWLAEEVENLAPSIIAPGNRRSPTIRPITKLTKNCPSDSWLLVQGTEVPGDTCKNVGPLDGVPGKGSQQNTTPRTSARDKRARSTSSQPDERQPPAGTNEFREWPDIPPTWELERDARGHLETEPNYPSNSVLGTIARQLLGWSPSAKGWLELLCGV